jgi:hypothetical protein
VGEKRNTGIGGKTCRKVTAYENNIKMDFKSWTGSIGIRIGTSWGLL